MLLLFNTLAMGLSPDQPVYGLQAKGINGIDEPLISIEDIAAYSHFGAIMEQNPAKPYALAGYSFGGIIAFEMARQLEAISAKEVKLLAMFDTYAYRSTHYDPIGVKLVKKGRFYFNRVWHTRLRLPTGFCKRTQYTDKATAVKQILIRAYWKLRYGKNQTRAGIFGYSNKVDEMNEYAEKHYQLKPYNIAVDVFRAKTSTFYLDEVRRYLGLEALRFKRH